MASTFEAFSLLTATANLESNIVFVFVELRRVSLNIEINYRIYDYKKKFITVHEVKVASHRTVTTAQSRCQCK